MSQKTLDNFVKDFQSVSKEYPKWIDKFRESFYKDATLPFLIVYQASAIFRNTNDISIAIAIATKQAQEKGFVFPGSNTLSLGGEVREIAIMKRLGEKKTKSYIKRFENALGK